MTTNDSLKLKREIANKLVDDIFAIKNNVQSIKESATTLYSKIDLKDREYKKLNQSLSRITKSTNEAIIDFRKKRDTVKTLLTQANNFYEKKYLPLVQKIEDKSDGFRAKIIRSNKELKELEKIKLNCSKQYDLIKELVSDYKVKSRELSTINTKIRKLGESSERNKLKTDTVHTHVVELEKQIKLLLVDSKKHNSETESLNKTIKKRELDAKELLKKIDSILEISKEKRDDIENVYQIAHETGLSGEFGNRRNQLKESVKKWEITTLISTIVLFIFVVLLFFYQLYLYDFDITETTFEFNFYIRFLILSPLVYYLIFSSTEYNKTKKLHDKYSFKTTLALTIKSHIELLTQVENFQTEERMDKILDFIIDGFSKIYNEPYTNDDFKMKIKLENIKLDLQKDLLSKFNLKDLK